MFPQGEDGRIPVVAVAGTNGKTTTVRLIAHMLGLHRAARRHDQLRRHLCRQAPHRHRRLQRPEERPQRAVAPGRRRGGVGNRARRHPARRPRHSTAATWRWSPTSAWATTSASITSAPSRTSRWSSASSSTASPPTAWPCSMPPTRSSRAWPTPAPARSPSSPTTATNRCSPSTAPRATRVVFVEGDAIVAAEHGAVVHRIALADIPLTRNGTISFQVENAMAATAAAWALGLDWNVIRRGLATFVSDAGTAPGRFNVFSYRGATLIADYGHNPDAIPALVHAVEAMPAPTPHGRHQRRGRPPRLGHPPADRNPRRRLRRGDPLPGPVPARPRRRRGARSCCARAWRNAKRGTTVEEIRGEFLAIDTALARLQPGDLCLILIDQVEEALDHIARRIAEAPTELSARAMQRKPKIGARSVSQRSVAL